MRRSFVRLAWLGALAAAVFCGWRFFFPNPQHVIRKELAGLARAASIGSNEGPLAKLANTQKVLGFFTLDAEITVDVPGRSLQTLNGREEIQQALLAAHSMLSNLQVDFVDVMITVDASGQTAVADLTATATLPGEKIPEVQELEFRFKKVEHDWLINLVKTIKTLR